MSNFGNKKTRWLCCHGGECELGRHEHNVVMGCSDSTTAKMILSGAIKGCGQTAPAKPCTQATMILTGTASGYEVGGSPPALTTLIALTNGGPPGVVTASGPVQSCALSTGLSRTAPRHKNASSTPEVPPKNSLKLSLRLDVQFLKARGVTRDWLPDGVTVTIVQPGTPCYWQTQFVELKTGDVATPVETKLPADRDTFVVIGSHPCVNDIGMLELADAPRLLVGFGKPVGVEPLAEWKGAARTYADVIAAAKDKSGLTAAVVALANLPWFEPTADIPMGVVFRVPERIDGTKALELPLRPAYPELVALAAELEGAEPLIDKEVRHAERAKLVERMGVAAFCKHVAGGGNTTFEKAFATLEDVGPRGILVDENQFPHIRHAPPSASRALGRQQPLYEFALAIHAEQTKSLAARVRLALEAVRRRLGRDAAGADPLARDYLNFVLASPFFLGTVELKDGVHPNVAEVYFDRTEENHASRLLERGLEVIDCGLNLLFSLQSVLEEKDRPISDADSKAWTDWMVEALARWLCAGSGAEPLPMPADEPFAEFPPGTVCEVPVDLETGTIGEWRCVGGPATRAKTEEKEQLSLTELYKTPARGWPLVIKQAKGLAGKAWKQASRKESFRAKVGKYRDVVMRWAAQKPDSKLWGRLLSLTASAESLAAGLDPKHLSTLSTHGTFSAAHADRAQEHRDAAKKYRGRGRNTRAVYEEKQAHGRDVTGRRLHAAQMSEVSARAMRWLLAPVVALHVINNALDPKSAIDLDDPFALQVLRQASAVGSTVQLMTGTAQAGITAKRLESASALRSLPLSEAQRAVRKADLGLFGRANRDLAKFTGPLDKMLKVIGVTTKLADAWADGRSGDRNAAGLEVLDALLPLGLELIPGVGPVLAFLYPFTIGAVIERLLAEEKLSADDRRFRELLCQTEFGRNGAAAANIVGVPAKDVKGRYADALYAGKCAHRATAHGADIRAHFYTRQLHVALARLPAGMTFKPGWAAGAAVRFTPSPGVSRFVRARLHPNGLFFNHVPPLGVDITADAVTLVRKDQPGGFRVNVKVTAVAVPKSPEEPEIEFTLGSNPVVGPPAVPAPPRPVTVEAWHCGYRTSTECAGERVPAMLNEHFEPVFFVDAVLYGGGPLFIKGIVVPEGGSAWLVFGPAPTAQEPKGDIAAAHLDHPLITLDVFPPGSPEPPTAPNEPGARTAAAEKPSDVRVSPVRNFISIQMRQKPSGPTDLRGAFGPYLEMEVLDRGFLKSDRVPR